MGDHNMYDTVTEPRGYLIAELPVHERPRERFLQAGADSLSDTELLAILLRTGARGRSALDLARELSLTFDGSLGRLASASVSELQQVKGIGRAKAVEIRAAFVLARRLSSRVGIDRPRVETPSEVVALLGEGLRHKQQEEFHVLLLDKKHHVLRDDCVTVGLVDRSQVHAREVYRRAISENCSALVLAHNHPTGDPTPSPQDIRCTRELVAAGKIVGISILDHVIIGRRTATRSRGYMSFREEKLL